MVAPVTNSARRKAAPAWHHVFLTLLPAIVRHARSAFRHLDADAREENVQEVACNARCAVARLAELDKLDLAYASVLARYGVAQVRTGRKVRGKLNCRDILSPYCQQVKGIVVERLDQFDTKEGQWQEVLVEDKTAGPADTARVRIDFGDWLRYLRRRDRRIAQSLAMGNRTRNVAERFRISAARISQLRGELAESWREFVGDDRLEQPDRRDRLAASGVDGEVVSS